MSARSSILGILSTIVSSIVLTYISVLNYENRFFVSLVLFIIIILLVISFLIFLDDFRYSAGKYSYKEFRNSPHSYYWEHKYGPQAYNEYKNQKKRWFRIMHDKKWIKL